MKRTYIYALACFFVFFIGGGIAYWSFFIHNIIQTDDAYVKTDLVCVNAQLGGYISEIYAGETDSVTKGQLLACLDKTEALTQLKHKKAALAWALRQTKELMLGKREAESNLKLRKAQLDKALFDYQQRKQLVKNGVISIEEYETAKTSLEVAQAAYELSITQFDNANVLAFAKTIEEHPLVLLAKEDLRKALMDYHRLYIYAPADGVIAKKNAQLGSSVDPSRPLFIIAPLSSIWIEANFKETQLEDLRVGQSAIITSDTYGNDVNYPAKVIGIGAGAGNVFALLPPQNATGNWIKVVQRVPVRLEIQRQTLKENPLCIGSSVSVSIHTQSDSGKGIFAGSSKPSIQTTDVFNHIYDKVETELQDILQEVIYTSSL